MCCFRKGKSFASLDSTPLQYRNPQDPRLTTQTVDAGEEMKNVASVKIAHLQRYEVNAHACIGMPADYHRAVDSPRAFLLFEWKIVNEYFENPPTELLTFGHGRR